MPTTRLRSIARHALSRRIRCGPLAGMRYLPAAFGSPLLPKIVGTYELEIQAEVLDRVRAAKNRIIDVGTAEGYYAVGALFLNADIQVTAYEAAPEAQSACRALARLNGVENRLTLKGPCTPSELAQDLRSGATDLVIIDIDGGETELCDPEVVPELAAVSLLVETHEAYSSGVRDLLTARFRATHTIREIPAGERSVGDIPSPVLRWLAAAIPPFASRCLSEFRPPEQTWLIMDPRGTVMKAR